MRGWCGSGIRERGCGEGLSSGVIVRWLAVLKTAPEDTCDSVRRVEEDRLFSKGTLYYLKETAREGKQFTNDFVA